MITSKSTGIVIDGHIGTWYVIDSMFYDEDVFLLESEIYGDEAACLIVNSEGNIILDEVYNGFQDLFDAELDN